MGSAKAQRGCHLPKATQPVSESSWDDPGSHTVIVQLREEMGEGRQGREVVGAERRPLPLLVGQSPCCGGPLPSRSRAAPPHPAFPRPSTPSIPHSLPQTTESPHPKSLTLLSCAPCIPMSWNHVVPKSHLPKSKDLDPLAQTEGGVRQLRSGLGRGGTAPPGGKMADRPQREPLGPCPRRVGGLLPQEGPRGCTLPSRRQHRTQEQAP